MPGAYFIPQTNGLATVRCGYVARGIMDRLPALEKVLQEEFVNVRKQQCQVHIAPNALAKIQRT